MATRKRRNTSGSSGIAKKIARKLRVVSWDSDFRSIILMIDLGLPILGMRVLQLILRTMSLHTAGVGYSVYVHTHV